MNKHKLYMSLLSVCLVTFVGCAKNQSTYRADTSNETVVSDTENAEKIVQVSTTEGINTDLKGEYSDKALDSSYHENDITTITLNGKTAKSDGNGAKIRDDSIYISKKGTYVLHGTLDDGQIIVELKENENVQLVLDNADITCSFGSAIQVISVKNLYLTLADGSKNSVFDGMVYKEDTSGDNPNAAVFSQEDLIINGSGSLDVTGNYRDGITSKDDLTIVEGNISVKAVDDALVGKDSVTLKNPVLNLSCGGDGIKSSNEKDTSKGFVVIDGGEVTINAGDDGIHSETALVINDGTINIRESKEGLESLNIVINNGDISVVSSDDGINISGGNDTTSQDVPVWGRGGGMDTPIDGALIINGGDITINADGDGIDSNGSILITGGDVIVAGPSNDGNGFFDYNGTFELDKGTVFAYGSQGMAQICSDCSSQTFIAASVESFGSGAEVTIYNSNDEIEASYTLEKQGTFIFYSSDSLVKDEVYTLKCSGNETKITAGDTTAVQSMGRNGMHGQGGLGHGENGKFNQDRQDMHDGKDMPPRN